MLRRLSWVFVLAGIAVFGASGCDEVDQEKFVATLEGSQENPPVNTNGRGNAVLLVSNDGSRVDLTVTLTSPLTGELRLAHIHKAARGSNGPVIHNIWVPCTGTNAATCTTTETFAVGSPIGRTFQFNAENLADLRAGNYYVNIHSSTSPGGEIRGQLVLED